jgi:hypothetical protein
VISGEKRSTLITAAHTVDPVALLPAETLFPRPLPSREASPDSDEIYSIALAPPYRRARKPECLRMETSARYDATNPFPVQKATGYRRTQYGDRSHPRHDFWTLKTQVMQLMQKFFDFNSVPLLFRQPDSCEEILALKFHLPLLQSP